VNKYTDGDLKDAPNKDALRQLSNGTYYLVTRFVGCWLESYSVSFPSESSIVMEDAAAKATDVTDGNTGFDSSNPLAYGEAIDAGNNPFNANQGGSELYGFVSRKK